MRNGGIRVGIDGSEDVIVIEVQMKSEPKEEESARNEEGRVLFVPYMKNFSKDKDMREYGRRNIDDMRKYSVEYRLRGYIRNESIVVIRIESFIWICDKGSSRIKIRELVERQAIRLSDKFIGLKVELNLDMKKRA